MKRQKLCGGFSWLVVLSCALLLAVALPVVASAVEPPQDNQLLVVAQESSNTHKMFQEPTAEEEQASKEARARIAQKTPPVQAEIKQLYDELLAMRNTMEFKELGFSGKNKTSNEWRNRVNALSARLKADDDIPINIKVAPGYLISLGMEKAWRQGSTTSDSKWNMQMVQDALNWKLEE